MAITLKSIQAVNRGHGTGPIEMRLEWSNGRHHCVAVPRDCSPWDTICRLESLVRMLRNDDGLLEFESTVVSKGDYRVL